MLPRPPALVTTEVLDECPRFRLLVVGKSGAGKSSLINHVFGVNRESVSHQERGQSNIYQEITSTQNRRFVIHDSMGFEPGNNKNLEAAKTFLEERSRQSVALKDRVHVIWLCIRVPHAGGAVFERGDKLFLDLASASTVPVVVVFTQFDKLTDSMYSNSDLTDLANNKKAKEIHARCSQKAYTVYQELCFDPLKRINPELRCIRSSGLAGGSHSKPDRQALACLIETTQHLLGDLDLGKDVQGAVSIVAAMAQRASAQDKIASSIKVGMKRYWKGLASSTNFLGWKFEDCLATIHQEITDSWNFNDTNELLNGAEFVKKIRKLAQLVTPDETEAKSWFENLEQIEGLVGLGGTIITTAAVGPAIGAIGLSAMFIQWIAKAYNQSPETLRCFMGYIVDLTLVMDQLFLVVLSMNPPRSLTEEDISKAVEKYRASHMATVHREIRRYANKASFPDLIRSTRAEEKVKSLIKDYCARNEPEYDASFRPQSQ